MNDYYAKLEQAEAKLQQILDNHTCDCGEEAVIDTIICKHTLTPNTVVVWCMCSGNGPVCKTATSLSILWKECE